MHKLCMKHDAKPYRTMYVNVARMLAPLANSKQLYATKTLLQIVDCLCTFLGLIMTL